MMHRVRKARIKCELEEENKEENTLGPLRCVSFHLCWIWMSLYCLDLDGSFCFSRESPEK